MTNVRVTIICTSPDRCNLQLADSIDSSRNRNWHDLTEKSLEKELKDQLSLTPQEITTLLQGSSPIIKLVSVDDNVYKHVFG